MGHRDRTSVLQELECSSETECVFSVYEDLSSTHETKPQENKNLKLKRQSNNKSNYSSKECIVLFMNEKESYYMQKDYFAHFWL